jgi:endonuclease YncB( thermonuclease family)
MGSQVHIRLAGVDAPELAHFGKPAQPHSTEALTFLTRYLLHRRVRAYIYRRDQYARVVATVYVRNWWPWCKLVRTDVGMAMLKRGLATVYEGKSAAEFGGDVLEGRYRKVEERAKRRGRGLWRDISKGGETPGEFKRRMKGEEGKG